MDNKKIIRSDLIYPELSYKIIGIMFEVYNELGPGYQEKHYQKAIAEAFKKHNLSFKEQVFIPLKFQDSEIGKYFLDFIVEDKIILEIKKGERFIKTNIMQLNSYLKTTNLNLGILINFTNNGLKFKRIVNLT